MYVELSVYRARIGLFGLTKSSAPSSGVNPECLLLLCITLCKVVSANLCAYALDLYLRWVAANALLFLSGDIESNPGPPGRGHALFENFLSCVYLNARSIKSVRPGRVDAPEVNKLHDFHKLLSLQDWDCICVTETWLNEWVLTQR